MLFIGSGHFPQDSNGDVVNPSSGLVWLVHELGLSNLSLQTGPFSGSANDTLLQNGQRNEWGLFLCPSTQ